MSKKRSVSDWQEEIRNGIRFQNLNGGIAEWRRYKDYYRHKFKRGILPVNIMFSVMRSMVAQTYFRNPSITVTAKKPGLKYQLHARIVQKLDRWFLKELMVKQQIKKMVEDTFFSGIATGFNGYDSEYGYDMSKTEANGAASLTQFDKKGYRIEYNSFVKPGLPWFLRARPDDVIFPWGTADKYNSEWIAMRKLRPLEDLKKDPKYKIPKDLSGSFIQRRSDDEGVTPPDQGYFQQMQNVRQWVELWQVHDIGTGKVLALTLDDSLKDFLRDDVDSMQVEDLPCEVLTFNPDPDIIYGVPDARIIEPQLLELNEIRTQFMKHRRIDIAKILYKKGTLDKNAVNRLLNEDVQAAVEVESESAIRDSVMELGSKAGGIFQDLGYAAELARQDVRETIGFSRVQSGEFQGKTHVTKAEVNHVMQRSDIRIDERRDQVADLLTNVIRKFNQTIFKHWTLPVVEDIVGTDGARYWLQFTGPEIANEYNYDINPASSAPQDPQSKKAEALEMARAWSEMNQGKIQQGIAVPAEIQRAFFSNYEDIDVEQLLTEQGVGMPTGGQGQAMPVNAAAQMMQQGGQQ